MKIKVKLTREVNAKYFNVNVGDVVEIAFELYLRGVVAAEAIVQYPHACMAQAVASRTFAYPYASKGEPITDSSSSHQAFRADLMFNDDYTIAHQAVQDTESEVLYYENKIISPCSFSSCNHGRTTSSESRWGAYRPYLIEQDDPWDRAANYSKKRGHGVGMSQVGAHQAAKQGVSYRDILFFYYPKTRIVKEESLMAQIKASDLVTIFKTMADEKWKYMAGAHKQGEVDCSGAFYYAYKLLGGYMYHGSNTMWRKYTVKKDKIGGITLVPGMAVFKTRNWSSAQSSNSWYNTDPGDVYHVGLYIGDGKVVEAKGTKHGVVITDISTWHLAATLKDTIYDLTEESAVESSENFETTMGVVKINSGWLNLRKEMSTLSERMGKLYGGDIVTVTGNHDDWYTVLYNNKTVYVKKNYIELMDRSKPQYTLSITVFGDDELSRMQQVIAEYGYKAKVAEGGAAA